MNDIIGKIKYLQGLVEGLEIEKNSKEGEILVAILDVLDDMAKTMDALRVNQEILQSFNDSIFDDMVEMENLFDYIVGNELAEILFEDEDVYEVICKNCGKTYTATFEDFDTDSVVCPHCQEPYVLDEEIKERLLFNVEEEDE